MDVTSVSDATPSDLLAASMRTMNTADVFSTQNTTEAAEVGKIDLDDDYKQIYLDIEWWMNAISYVTLPVVGGFGTILTFIVMQRGSLKDVSTCFYMSMLALADTGLLWTGYFPAWIVTITKGRVNAYGWTDCKLPYFCSYFFRHYSSALLVMMSIEKCIALYFPFKTRNISTVRTAKWASGIVFVVFFLLNSFWFFVIKAQKEDGGATYVVCVFEDFSLKTFLIWERIDGVLYSFGPIVIMGLANIAIIYKFIRTKMTSKHGGTESTNQALGNAAMRGTAIMIIVTMTFIILTAPAQITFAIAYNIHPLLAPFLYISLALNHGINGFLYMTVGSKFRKELIATLRCIGRQNGADVSRKSLQESNVSYNTETTSP